MIKRDTLGMACRAAEEVRALDCVVRDERRLESSSIRGSAVAPGNGATLWVENKNAISSAIAYRTRPFFLSLFQTLFVGPVGGMAYDNSEDLTNELGRLGVSAADQTAIVNMNPNGSYVIWRIEVPDSNTQAFGIPLHDGDMPDESNDIVITVSWRILLSSMSSEPS
jgi:hypothetical protein